MRRPDSAPLVALAPEERQCFRRWLEDSTQLSRRSRDDVLSRAGRVMTMIDPLQPKSRAELAYRLSESPEYQGCSSTVRSQLKRAAVLFRKFHGLETGGRS